MDTRILGARRLKHDPHCLYFVFNKGEYRIATWDLALSCEVKDCDDWIRGEYPEIQIIPSANKVITDLTLRWFLDGVPTEVKKLVSELHCYQLIALNIIKINKYALDLLKSTPALFLILCHRIASKDLYYKDVSSLCCEKRRVIIKRLFGETCYSASFFKKIKLGTYNHETLLKLWNFLVAQRRNKSVLHWGKVYYYAAYGYRGHKQILSDKIIQKFSNIIGECVLEQYSKLAEEICHIGENRIPSTIKNCSSYTELKAVREELSKMPTTEERDKLTVQYGKIFPKTIIPGNDKIVPLQNIADLQHEAEIMRHCVFTYAESVYSERSSNLQSNCPRKSHAEDI